MLPFWRKDMSTLVIKAFPEALHARLRHAAAAHRRSVTQETIHLIETALNAVEAGASNPVPSYWASRRLLPEFEAALKSGAFGGGSDSTRSISEDRGAQ